MRFPAPHITHQNRMHLAKESPRYREFRKPIHAEVHGADVVEDFDNVHACLCLFHLRFKLQYVHEGCVGTFYLAGQHCLATDVLEDEEVRVRNNLNGSIKTPKSHIRL